MVNYHTSQSGVEISETLDSESVRLAAVPVTALLQPCRRWSVVMGRWVLFGADYFFQVNRILSITHA